LNVICIDYVAVEGSNMLQIKLPRLLLLLGIPMGLAIACWDDSEGTQDAMAGLPYHMCSTDTDVRMSTSAP
jgi:hypothetical protein